MVEDVVRNKIRSLMRSLERVRTKIPASADALANDVDLQDIVVINLERAVQQAVDIATYVIADHGLRAPSGMADGFRILSEQGWISDATASSMRAATGFRNIAVHEYDKLNWQIVYAIGTVHLDDFRRYVAELNESSAIRL
ncbi:MAG: hypothetical protein CMP06_04615 [Xanthomonadales bacterium]|jgi:uncharacterized protein YutE (UPF0331/DUF86 family)|nr:hypothetical protein [Xanthomonadales bacterium]